MIGHEGLSLAFDLLEPVIVLVHLSLGPLPDNLILLLSKTINKDKFHIKVYFSQIINEMQPNIGEFNTKSSNCFLINFFFLMFLFWIVQILNKPNN